MWSDFCQLNQELLLIMKAIYSILLIFVFVSSVFAQKTNTSGTGFPIENLSFSITKIYPNPVKDLVTVELQSVEAAPIQASLINILGTEVKKWEIGEVQKGDQKLKFDLSFLKTGIYFLKISNSGKVVTQVLKKN